MNTMNTVMYAICEECLSTFIIKNKFKDNKFCSQKCYHNSSNGRVLQERYLTIGDITTKRCSYCEVYKSLDEFGKDKNTLDLLKHKCKICLSIIRQKLREKHLEHYRELEREKSKKESTKIARQKREKIRQYEDPIYKLTLLVRKRMWNVFSRIKNGKSAKALELLGCDWGYLKKYIEDKLPPGSTWSMFGFGEDKFQIDHIIPISSFDLSDPEEQKKCFHYTNLQPMFGFENQKKSNKLLYSDIIYD